MIRTALVVLVATSSLAAPKPPAGVRYVPAQPAANAKAKATLEKMFGTSPPRLEVPEKLLMLGPFLGRRLVDLDLSPFLPVDAMIPLGETTAHLRSVGARTPAEARELLGLIRDLAPGPAPTIRPMSPAEMALVWPFIAWDLTEPLFVVESKQRKWLVNFDREGEQLSWIEDLTEPCFATSEDQCTCVGVERKGSEWTLVRIPKPASPAPAQRRADALVELRLTQLHQPDAVLKKRLLVEPIVAYIERLRAALETALPTKQGKPTALVVSVAVKEGQDHRLWLTASKQTPLSRPVVDALHAALMKVEAPTTRGLVVFQLHFQLWGGPTLSRETFETFPDEWRAVTAKHAEPVDVESLVLEAWR